MEKIIQEKKIIRVLGIDPGLAHTGYGIIDFSNNRLKYVVHGEIETKPCDSNGLRLLQIYDKLDNILELYKPSQAGMETLFFAKNVSSALPVAQSRGVVSLLLEQRNIFLGEYSPNEIKKAVSGTIISDKKIVQESVKLLLGLPFIPEPNHAADALAVAIAHIFTTSCKIPSTTK